jgi:hypothetical protein
MPKIPLTGDSLSLTPSLVANIPEKGKALA